MEKTIEKPEVTEKEIPVMSVDTDTVKPTEEKEPTLEEKLEQLKDFRRNGSIAIEISFKDFKYMRNVFKTKTPWNGANEAYLLCVLNMNLEQILSSMDKDETKAQKVTILNSSVEAASIFMNKISGSNLASAQNNLSMLMVLNQAIAQLQMIDKELKTLNDEVLTKEASPIKKVKKS